MKNVSIYANLRFDSLLYDTKIKTIQIKCKFQSGPNGAIFAAWENFEIVRDLWSRALSNFSVQLEVNTKLSKLIMT